MIISFSVTLKLAEQLKTPDPLVTGIKTVTRRNWTQASFSAITAAYNRGRTEHDAWTNCSYVSGSHPFGKINLTQKPYWEKLGEMPEEDVYHEGNLWSSREEFIKMLGIPPETRLCVIRFTFKEI